MTRSRDKVLEILLNEGRHLSATELWELSRKSDSPVSLATIYNCLRALVEDGAIREISHPSGNSLYDARLDPHSHLHCTSCGTLTDIDLDRGIASLEDQARELSGYSQLRSDITLRGICPLCRDKGGF